MKTASRSVSASAHEQNQRRGGGVNGVGVVNVGSISNNNTNTTQVHHLHQGVVSATAATAQARAGVHSGAAMTVTNQNRPTTSNTTTAARINIMSRGASAFGSRVESLQGGRGAGSTTGVGATQTADSPPVDKYGNSNHIYNNMNNAMISNPNQMQFSQSYDESGVQPEVHQTATKNTANRCDNVEEDNIAYRMESTPFAKSLAYVKVTAEQSQSQQPFLLEKFHEGTTADGANAGDKEGDNDECLRDAKYANAALVTGAGEHRAGQVVVDDHDDIINETEQQQQMEEDQEDSTQQPHMVVSIKDLTNRIIQLQKKSHSLFKSGKNLQCPSIVDQIVKIRISIEGSSSQSLIDYITQAGRLFNQAALELLSHDEPEEALQMLQATQNILEQVDQQNSKVSQLASLTLNTMSYVFKRKGEIQEAHECLKKALMKAKIKQKHSQHQHEFTTNSLSTLHHSKNTTDDDARSDQASEAQQLEAIMQENQPLFHMNLCALFSQQGCHEKAKTHASIAVKDLERSILLIKQQIEELEMIVVNSPNMNITDQNNDQNNQQNQVDSTHDLIQSLKNKFKDRLALLAIAYFNLGCEYEHLNQLEDCLEAYERATGLNINQYGHQAIDGQFQLALRQVQQRLQDQKLHLQNVRKSQQTQANQKGHLSPSKQKGSGPKSPQRRSKQPPRYQQNAKSKSKNSGATVAVVADSQDQDNTQLLGQRMEKTFEAILHMNRMDGAPKSFESSQKNANNYSKQCPVSESNQIRSTTKQWIGSSTNSESRLKQILEEKNIGGTNSNFQEQFYNNNNNNLFVEMQSMTPVKQKMTRTGQGFAPAGKPIEPEQLNRRVMSSSTQKRPQSAHNIQEDLFDSNLSKQQCQQRGAGVDTQQFMKINHNKIPLAVSSDWKATKCLKQSNWTKKWFQNAYISVNASTKLQDALAAAECETKKRTHSIGHDSNSQNSRNLLSRHVFSSNQKDENQLSNQEHQDMLPIKNNGSHKNFGATEALSAQVVSKHTQSLINLRPSQANQQQAGGSQQNHQFKQVAGRKTRRNQPQVSKSCSEQHDYQPTVTKTQSLINSQHPVGEPVVVENGGKHSKRKDVQEFMFRYVYALPPQHAQHQQVQLQHHDQHQRTASASKHSKNQSKAFKSIKRKLRHHKMKESGRGTSSPNRDIAYFPQITGQPSQNQMMMSRTMPISVPPSADQQQQNKVRLRAAFSSKSPSKNIIIDKPISSKLGGRSSSLQDLTNFQPQMTRNVVYTTNSSKPLVGSFNQTQKSYGQIQQPVILSMPMSKKQRERARLQSEIQFHTTSQQLKNIDFFNISGGQTPVQPQILQSAFVAAKPETPEPVQFLITPTTAAAQTNCTGSAGSPKARQSSRMGASRGLSEQRRGGGQGRHRQSSQAKMMKHQKAFSKIGGNFQLYTGQIEAAERYTQGPIVQVIQPFHDGERKLLVTQAINLKNKKPEVLIKQLMQSRSTSNSRQQVASQGSAAGRQKTNTQTMKVKPQEETNSQFSLNYQQIKNGLAPVIPPNSVSQPAISSAAKGSASGSANPIVMKSSQKPPSPPSYESHSESAFTKGVRQKVIRRTQKIIDQSAAEFESIQLQQATIEVSCKSGTGPQVDDDFATKQEFTVTISEEPNPAEEDEIATGAAASQNVEVINQQLSPVDSHHRTYLAFNMQESIALTKACLVIQAYFRGQQARQIVEKIKIQQCSKDKGANHDNCHSDEQQQQVDNTLELDDDYKDDAFDSADGKSDKIHSLDEQIVGTNPDNGSQSNHFESNKGTYAKMNVVGGVDDGELLDQEEFSIHTEKQIVTSAPTASIASAQGVANNHENVISEDYVGSDKNIASLMIEEESIIEDFNKNPSKSLIIQESGIKSSQMLQIQPDENIKPRQDGPLLFKTTNNDAIDSAIQNENSEDKIKIQQKVRQIVLQSYEQALEMQARDDRSIEQRQEHQKLEKKAAMLQIQLQQLQQKQNEKEIRQAQEEIKPQVVDGATQTSTRLVVHDQEPIVDPAAVHTATVATTGKEDVSVQVDRLSLSQRGPISPQPTQNSVGVSGNKDMVVRKLTYQEEKDSRQEKENNKGITYSSASEGHDAFKILTGENHQLHKIQHQEGDIADDEVQFMPIDEAEIILCEAIRTQPQPKKFRNEDEMEDDGDKDKGQYRYKIQVALLPFDRGDLGGAKLAFKGINLNDATFQNELIHIDLALSQDELQSDKEKVNDLIESLEINRKNGNISLPQKDDQDEVALFSMFVSSEEGQDKEREVIAILKKEGQNIDGNQGHVIVLQTMTNQKNKVTIPLKKSMQQTKITELKKNLEKRLPQIIYVDKNGNVALSNDERERIGRVLPSGQAIQEIYLDYQSNTCISVLDRQHHTISPNIKANDSYTTKKCNIDQSKFEFESQSINQSDANDQQQDQSSYSSNQNINMSISDTFHYKVQERKINRMKPSSILLENKITQEPRRLSQYVSLVPPKDKSIHDEQTQLIEKLQSSLLASEEKEKESSIKDMSVDRNQSSDLQNNLPDAVEADTITQGLQHDKSLKLLLNQAQNQHNQAEETPISSIRSLNKQNQGPITENLLYKESCESLAKEMVIRIKKSDLTSNTQLSKFNSQQLQKNQLPQQIVVGVDHLNLPEKQYQELDIQSPRTSQNRNESHIANEVDADDLEQENLIQDPHNEEELSETDEENEEEFTQISQTMINGIHRNDKNQNQKIKVQMPKEVQKQFRVVSTFNEKQRKRRPRTTKPRGKKETVEDLCLTEIVKEQDSDLLNSEFGCEHQESSSNQQIFAEQQQFQQAVRIQSKQKKKLEQKQSQPLAETIRDMEASLAFEELTSDESSYAKIVPQQQLIFTATSKKAAKGQNNVSVMTKSTCKAPEKNLSNMNQEESNVSSLLHQVEMGAQQEPVQFDYQNQISSQKSNKQLYDAETLTQLEKIRNGEFSVEEGKLSIDQNNKKEQQQIMLEVDNKSQQINSQQQFKTQQSSVKEDESDDISRQVQQLPLYASPEQKSTQSFSQHAIQVFSNSKKVENDALINSNKSEMSFQASVPEQPTQRKTQIKTSIEVNYYESNSIQSDIKPKRQQDPSPKWNMIEVETKKDLKGQSTFQKDSFVSSLQDYQSEVKVIVPAKEENLMETARQQKQKQTIERDPFYDDALSINCLQSSPQIQSQQLSSLSVQLDKAEFDTQTDQQIMSPLEVKSNQSSLGKFFNKEKSALQVNKQPTVSSKDHLKHNTPRAFRNQMFVKANSLSQNSIPQEGPIQPEQNNDNQSQNNRMNEQDLVLTTLAQDYRTDVIENHSFTSSLHEINNPQQSKKLSEQRKTQVENRNVITPRQCRTKPLLKLDTFVSSIQQDLPQAEENIQQLKYMEVPACELKVDQETPRDKKVNTILKHDTHISSIKEDSVCKVPQLPDPPKKVDECRIETNRNVSSPLKKIHTQNESSLTQAEYKSIHQQSGLQFDPEISKLNLDQKPEPATTIPVLKQLQTDCSGDPPSESPKFRENIQDTRRSTQVNALLKHDTHISSLKEYKAQEVLQQPMETKASENKNEGRQDLPTGRARPSGVGQELLEQDSFVSDLKEPAPQFSNQIDQDLDGSTKVKVLSLETLMMNEQEEKSKTSAVFEEKIGDTARKQEVSKLLKHETFVSSLKEDEQQVPDKNNDDQPKSQIEQEENIKQNTICEIPTSRGTEVKQSLLKQDSIDSSLHDEGNQKQADEDNMVQSQIIQLQMPQIVATPKKQEDQQECIETKRGTAVKTLLKQDSLVSSLHDESNQRQANEDNMMQSQIPQLQMSQTVITPKKQQNQQECVETKRGTAVKTLLKQETHVSSLKDYDNDNGIQKISKKNSRSQLNRPKKIDELYKQASTHRQMEINASIQHDSDVSSRLELNAPNESPQQVSLIPPINLLPTTKQEVETHRETQDKNKVTLIKHDTNVSSLIQSAKQAKVVNKKPENSPKPELQTNREAIKAGSSLSQIPDSSLHCDSQLLLANESSDLPVKSVEKSIAEPATPINTKVKNFIKHGPVDNTTVEFKEVQVEQVIKPQEEEVENSIVEPATPINTKVKNSIIHGPVDNTIVEFKEVKIEQVIKPQEEQKQEIEQFTPDVETPRHQIEISIAQKSCNSSIYSNMPPRPKKVPVKRPKSASKQQINQKDKSIVESRTQKSIWIQNSLQTESRASAEDIKFWQNMQKKQPKVTLPKPKRKKSVKKSNNSRSREGSSSKTQIAAALEFHSAGESIAVSQQVLPQQKDKIQIGSSRLYINDYTNVKEQESSLFNDREISDPQLSCIQQEKSFQDVEPVHSQKQQMVQSEDDQNNNLIKINPSRIKSVKTKKTTSQNKSNVVESQQKSQQIENQNQFLLSNQPSTRKAQNLKNMQSLSEQSEFTEIAMKVPLDFNMKKSQKEISALQTTNQSIEMSTVRNVQIDRGIRYLYVQKHLKQNSPVKRFNTSVNQTNSHMTGVTGFLDVKRPSMPNSINQSRISSQVTKDRLNQNHSAVDKEPSVEESKGTMKVHLLPRTGSEESIVEKDLPKNRPLTPVPENVNKGVNYNSGSATVNDWRAGVKVKFEVTGSNSSTVQLMQNNEVIDSKNLAFNLLKVSHNYDFTDLTQFCSEQLMQCVSIKDAEWITTSIQEDSMAYMPNLQLHINSNKLSELLTKQFTNKTDSRPTSGNTDFKNEDERDEARMYTQEPTAQSESINYLQ